MLAICQMCHQYAVMKAIVVPLTPLSISVCNLSQTIRILMDVSSSLWFQVALWSMHPMKLPQIYYFIFIFFVGCFWMLLFCSSFFGCQFGLCMHCELVIIFANRLAAGLADCLRGCSRGTALWRKQQRAAGLYFTPFT